MGFASGSISFRRFAVIGPRQPKAIDQPLLDKLTEYRLELGELSVPDEVEYGWSGGRHLFDGTFSFENNVFADALLFGLRIDTNKVPGEVKKAYQLMEEDAAAASNPSGFISRNQKRDVKDIVRRKVEEDLRSGRFRRSKLVPVLWDTAAQVVYGNASGEGLEKLMELFERTFKLSLQPLSAGSLALRLLEPHGRRRDYEDMRPTRFINGPEGESQQPEYPWVAKGPEPKDFVGNEFLLWLWHQADARQGTISTEKAGDVAILMDRALELDCAYGTTGRDWLRGDGASRMPEARDALRSGKLPRKAAIVLHAAAQEYRFGFNPESLAFAGARLPEVEEAENPRVLFEERVSLLRDLCTATDALFETFLKVRTSSGWEGQVGAIRRWIQQAGRPATAVV